MTRWTEVIYSITEQRLAEHWQPRAQVGAPLELCAEMGALVEAIIARIFFGEEGRANNDTTIAGLIWTFILLAKHQTVRSRVMHEIDTVAPTGEPLSQAGLSRLSYTTAVIEESLRLHPPAYTYVRKVAQEDTIRGYDIPQASAIILSPYVSHRDPVCWPEAEKFDPDRFASQPEVVRPPYAYHPFGGGQRSCLGRHLAMLKMTIILASVLEEV